MNQVNGVTRKTRHTLQLPRPAHRPVEHIRYNDWFALGQAWRVSFGKVLVAAVSPY